MMNAYSSRKSASVKTSASMRCPTRQTAKTSRVEMVLYMVLSFLFSRRFLSMVKYAAAFSGFILVLAIAGGMEAGTIPMVWGFLVCAAMGIAVLLFFKPSADE